MTNKVEQFKEVNQHIGQHSFDIITPPKPNNSFRSKIKRYAQHKIISVPAGFLFIAVVLSIIPASRYFLPGLFMKKQAVFVLQEASTGGPVSDADVVIDGVSYKSNQDGRVLVDGIKPGYKKISITKPFYTDFSAQFHLGVFKNKEQKNFAVIAKGKIAKVIVKNRLSGRLLAGVQVKTDNGSTGLTNDSGVATLILASSATEVSAIISSGKILSAKVTVRAVQDDSTNVLLATPTGRLYFLSRASGIIDVISSNLDGSDRKTVLAGTGQEDRFDTILLASRDWKYLALKARRDSGQPKVYLIETSNGALTTVDEGNASFSFNGWSGDSFVYSLFRTGVEQWQNKQSAIKSYNAATKKLVTLDETRGEGKSVLDYANESIGSVYITKNQVVYTKKWSASYYYGTRLADKKMVIAAVMTDGSSKKSLFEWQAGYNTYISSLASGPDEIYFNVQLDGVVITYYEYTNGEVKLSEDVTAENFRNNKYFTYLVSPNGNNTLWSEPRDGKNSLFIGDAAAKNDKQIASLSELVPYGWYTDDYILVSKNSSELYIMGRDGVVPGRVPLKVTDYHKSQYDFRGYGYGYGGF